MTISPAFDCCLCARETAKVRESEERGCEVRGRGEKERKKRSEGEKRLHTVACGC